MYKQIAIYIISFAANLSILQGIIHLLTPKKTFKHFQEILIFFCIGLFLLQHQAILSGFVLNVPHVIFLNNTLFFLLCYLVIVLFSDRLLPEGLKKRHVLLIILMTISLANDIYIFLQNSDKKLIIIKSLLAGNNSNPIIIMKVLFSLAGAIIIFHLFKMILQTASVWRECENTSVIIITLIYSFLAIVAIVLALIGYIHAIGSSMLAGIFIASVIVIFDSIITNIYPSIFTILKSEVEKKNYNRSLLHAIDTDLKVKELNDIMTKSRPYLDEECSLQQIADELELTAHQLSQLINEHLSMNFNSYINKYRIDEACNMLVEEKDRSVLSIAYAVGFNSNSSFYEAFSKNTGKTPKQYRKDNIK